MHMSEFRAWSEIIRTQSLNGRHDEVLSQFVSKLRYPFGFRPDHLILQSALKSCALLPALKLGRALHCYVTKLGHLSCLSVSKGLLNLYAKAKDFSDCKKQFDHMPKSDTVVWNIVLAGLSSSHVHDAEFMSLVYKMHFNQEAELSPVTAAIVLPVCARLGCLSAGRSLHSYAIKDGWGSETLVGNSLISMYAKCGRIHDGAYPSFCEIDEKDVVSWNAIISGCAENGFQNDACALFKDMLMGPVGPNYATLASILPVCAALDRESGFSLGRRLHAYVLKESEFCNNVFVVNALMSFYLRMGLFEDAKIIFDGMASRDLVSWNAIISGCVSNNAYCQAIYLFQEMVSGQMLEPDSVTLLSVLPACAHLNDLNIIKQIHGYIIQHPCLNNDTAISNALINSYAECDDLDSSFMIFMMISQRDLISWNSLLDAFARDGCELQFVSLVNQMIDEGLRPDFITMLTLIRYYGGSSKLLKVKEAHGYLLRACLHHGSLDAALLDAYGKCGLLDYAHEVFRKLLGDSTNSVHKAHQLQGQVCKVFENLSQADLLTWNLIIRACVCNNHHEDAASLLFELQVQGMKPGATTIMSILPMCVKMASADLLRQCHGYVIRACIEDVQLKGTLIDVYSKCGSVSSAAKLFWSSTHKDLVMFTALIGGYAMHGMGSEALGLFKHMLEAGIHPDHVVITAVLSACSHTGLVDEGLCIFDSIEEAHGLKPTMEQYGCVVDLLARQGKVKDAYSFVTEMPVKPNASIWSILLGACNTYNEVELSQIIADHLITTEDKDVGSYITMSNLLAVDANWDGVLEVRKQIKTIDFKKPAGCSWT